ncbi:MAG: metalloprotease [Candidatus Nanohaloarchaea archaeon]|nr:metalloprotease [Candidatus Nanohaloarchaea archaeon]
MKIITEEGRKSYQHSREEVRNLFISSIALGIAFAIAIYGGSNRITYFMDPSFPLAAIISGVLAGTSLLAKELAQKGTSRAIESYTQYEIWSPGIILAVLGSFLGIVVAAVGGTRVFTEYTERAGRWRVELSPQHLGIVGSIGPMMTLSLAMGFLMLQTFSPMLLGKNLFIVAAQINAFISLFSMVPINPLDGSKTLRWNVVLWAFIVLMSLAVLALSFGWI